ncbi:MAG: hypothetical protein JHD16_04240 [Solirubrobacteraceae bacterium]|nr:hypothetical protein [Solirubrobacteraceae bacterium]
MVAAALAFGAAGWSFAAPPAVAALAPIQVDAVDPVGDAAYRGGKAEGGVDIVAFSVTQDREAKVVRGSVTFDGNVDTPDLHELRVGLGLDNGYGGCNISDGYGWVHIRHDMATDVADYVISTNVDIRQDVAITRTDKQVSFVTPAGPGVFDGRGFRCIVVRTERMLGPLTTDFENPQDVAMGWAVQDTTPPAAVVDPGNGIPAPILDADRDGVRDGIDKCPQAAGAATNGCEAVPLASSIKLGTKRVVVNRLLESTSGACPKTVKIVVKVGRKTLAKQAAGTITKGKYCHVVTVVPLKKRASKARVAITGTGIVSVAENVKK